MHFCSQDTQPQRAQRVDYNRLKREHVQETTNHQQHNNYHSTSSSTRSELLEYAYPFHYRSDKNHGKTWRASARTRQPQQLIQIIRDHAYFSCIGGSCRWTL